MITKQPWYLLNIFKLLCLIMVSLSTNATAVTELHGDIVELKPWGGTDGDGRPNGYHPKLVRLLEKESKIKLHYAITPLKRINQYLRTGKTDFSIIFVRDEFAFNVDIVNDVQDLSLYLIFARQTETQRTIGTNKNLRFGVILGEEKLANGIFAKQGYGPHKVVNAKSYERLFKMAEAGRIDAVFYVGDAFEHYLVDGNIQRQQFGEKRLLQDQKVYFLLTKNARRYSPALSQHLHDAIERLKNSGELFDIYF